MWADGLIWTHCPLTFDVTKREITDSSISFSFVVLLQLSFFISSRTPPFLAVPGLFHFILLFHPFIIKTQNVSQCFYCKCWTYSIMVMSIYCTQRLGASCLTALQFLPEWPHRMQLSEEMPEKFFHLPQKFGGKLHTWFFSEPQLVCNLGSSLRPLTPKDLDPSVPTRDPLDGSTQPSSYS